jgi:hypothetical protein
MPFPLNKFHFSNVSFRTWCGIHSPKDWIPAFAGMTKSGSFFLEMALRVQRYVHYGSSISFSIDGSMNMEFSLSVWISFTAVPVCLVPGRVTVNRVRLLSFDIFPAAVANPAFFQIFII